MEFFAVFLTHMDNSEEVFIVETISKHTLHDQVVSQLDSLGIMYVGFSGKKITRNRAAELISIGDVTNWSSIK